MRFIRDLNEIKTVCNEYLNVILMIVMIYLNEMEVMCNDKKI